MDNVEHNNFLIYKRPMLENLKGILISYVQRNQ
jgi:hypothetical protein